MTTTNATNNEAVLNYREQQAIRAGSYMSSGGKAEVGYLDIRDVAKSFWVRDVGSSTGCFALDWDGPLDSLLGFCNHD